MDEAELQQRLAELEQAEAAYRTRAERQIQDLTTRVEILEKFLTERYG